jgi:hypothetical protein
MGIPTDDAFFSKADKSKPDIAFLKNHFYREGRLKEEHALYIVEKATQLLRTEPNVLTIDAPVTGPGSHPALPSYISNRYLQYAGTFTANTCVSCPRKASLVPLSG